MCRYTTPHHTYTHAHAHAHAHMHAPLAPLGRQRYWNISTAGHHMPAHLQGALLSVGQPPVFWVQSAPLLPTLLPPFLYELFRGGLSSGFIQHHGSDPERILCQTPCLCCTCTRALAIMRCCIHKCELSPLHNDRHRWLFSQVTLILGKLFFRSTECFTTSSSTL